jgi:hypothetical protein
MTSTPIVPWYRQPWPWFLIALPAMAVCASFYTLYLALSAPEALVRDEYDRNGLEVTRRLGQDARARELGLEAHIGFSPSGTVYVELSPLTPTPAGVRLQLIHPTAQSQDQVIDLRLVPDGRYRAALARPEGKRYLQLEAGGPASEWRLRGVLDAGDAARARLLPGGD